MIGNNDKFIPIILINGFSETVINTNIEAFLFIKKIIELNVHVTQTNFIKIINNILKTSSYDSLHKLKGSY